MNLVSRKILTFTWTYIIPIVIITIYLSSRSCIREDIGDAFIMKHAVKYSSVWCNTGLNNAKLCQFKDVCYEPKVRSFLFFLGNLSVIKGLYNYSELQTIQLSSVKSHNAFEANISVVDVDYVIDNPKIIKKGLLFSRFKPNNIMHVIHDDLMPVFLTLEKICLGQLTSCEKGFRLVINDYSPRGPYIGLYKLFTLSELVFINKVTKTICFEELHMGLMLDSIFYQYGFDQVQGQVENIKLTHNDITRFTSFISRNLNVIESNSKTHVVLVSRKSSRRILNEHDFIQMLTLIFKNYSPQKEVVISKLDLAENNTSTFIRELSKATALVGMHGAEMIFSLFLKPQTTVIELFPYGIQPEVVSFLKPLSTVQGINFHYISWKNSLRNHSVFHPDADQLHGGLSHLPQKDQDEIKNVQIVPAVRCCNNPMYLYYMYQDTWIETAFVDMVSKDMNIHLSRDTSNVEKKMWFFPSTVANGSCSYNVSKGFLIISWSPPFNVKSVFYDILVKEMYSDFVKNFVTDKTELKIQLKKELKLNIKDYLKFQVWISAISHDNNSTRSKDVYYECN